MTDRDQVAREVLTPFLAELTEWPEAHAFGERYMQRHFPAPAALVTVTVEGVTWTKHADPDGSVWLASVGGPASRSDAEEFLDRIASDARRIEELERERDGWERRTKEIGSVVIRAWALLRDWWQYAQLEEREEPFVDALTRALAADAAHDAYALAEIRRWRDVAGEAARLAQEGE